MAGNEVATFQPARLPYHPMIEERFGVDRASWKALTDAVWPAAKSTDSVVLALAYCKARRLDPFKRPVHIVPVWSSDRRDYVDTVWPGIGELRTTAFRTGEYAGCDPTDFGDDMNRTLSGRVGKKGQEREVTADVTFPAWAQVTVYRMVQGNRVPVPGPRVFWLEAYGRMGGTEVPNDMWQKRPRGQIEKCAEAAALRKAFPEEIGNEYTADEMEGQVIAGPIQRQTEIEPPPPPTRAEFAEVLEPISDEAQAEADRQGLREMRAAMGETLLTDDGQTDWDAVEAVVTQTLAGERVEVIEAAPDDQVEQDRKTYDAFLKRIQTAPSQKAAEDTLAEAKRVLLHRVPESATKGLTEAVTKRLGALLGRTG